MASGDVVGDIYTSATTFQPSAGTQICITQFITTAENRVLGRGDINTTAALEFTTATGQSNNMRLWNGNIHKFLISNTSYVYFDLSGGSVGFVGIEI